MHQAVCIDRRGQRISLRRLVPTEPDALPETPSRRHSHDGHNRWSRTRSRRLPLRPPADRDKVSGVRVRGACVFSFAGFGGTVTCRGGSSSSRVTGLSCG
jgi:hypothetical protein